MYIAGTFESSSFSLGQTTLANAGPAGTVDVFVAKLVDDGNVGSFAWAQRGGGVGNDMAGGVAANGPNVYLTGTYDNTATFGTTTLPNSGSRDVLVAKLTDTGSTGSFAWA
jgi:hypothetical protein